MTRQTALSRALRGHSWVLLAALVLSGCGSLRSHEDIVRAAGGAADQGESGAVDTTGGQGPAGTDGPAGGTAGSAPGTSSNTGSAPGTTTGGMTPGAGGDSRPGAAPGGTAGSKVDGSTDHGVVTIGNVSTTSGIAGGAQRPGVVGLQAWVQATNAKGGVNGHLLKLITRDDQSDPNQNASYTQALVEQSKVLAFVSNWAGQTQAASADYLKSKSIPVIGGDHNGERSWGVNPMFFPTASIGQDAVRNTVAALAKVAVPQGRTKLGILVCAEAAICTNGAKTSAAYASKVGFTVVYNASAAFTAPGYTAECLAMRNAGVQAVHLIFPASATKKVARDCTRQGLKVIYSLANGTMEGDFNEDPSFEGSAVQQSVFPFAGASTPVAAEYQAAMRKYAPEQISNPASASGYASGVVFGAALAKVRGPVTTAKLLAALYTVKDETFGGATIPLTFKNGPMVPPGCYFLSIIKSGQYVVQNGGKFLCQR